MLAILAQNGYKGAEAGTLLRNTMIRLVAPTKSASDMMDDLGYEAEDIAAALGDDGALFEKYMQQLESYGFSVYDQTGNLKSFYQIIT